MVSDKIEQITSEDPQKKAHRVLIVDPHPLMRDQLASLVRELPGFCPIGGASNKVDALDGIEKHRPDVVITELSLGPGRNGLELTKDIVARFPAISVIVFSMYDELLYAERALKAGAKAYISKEEEREVLVNALLKTVSGGFYISNALSERIVAQFMRSGVKKQPRRGGIEALSDRELEVFQLIGQSRTTREIAAELKVETKTVETYRARIKKKLRIATGAELHRCSLEFCQAGLLEEEAREA